MQGTGTGGADRAFTLIELLVVIGVIAILLGIAVTLGSAVISGGKATRTEQTIGVLDSMLTSYQNERGRSPSESVMDPRDEDEANPAYWPIADARNMSPGDRSEPEYSDHLPINTVGLLLLQLEDVPAVRSSLESLDPAIVSRIDVDGPPGNVDVADIDTYGNNPSESIDMSDAYQPELLTIVDGWRRPIRFVHPAFDGVQFGSLPTVPPSLPPNNPVPFDGDPLDIQTSGQFTGKIVPRSLWATTMIRRNAVRTLDAEGRILEADSDGGICRGDQAYFYSAGEDEDPGDVGDNVYTTKPQFPVIRN